MDANGLPIVGAAIDLTKVPSIHHKRTLAFLNHFIGNTVNFLNKFSYVCETKLEDINTRIQKIETSLSILEAKLSSIPGLDDVVTSVPNTLPQLPRPDVIEQVSIAPISEVKDDDSVNVTTTKELEASEQLPTLTVAQDPRYSKYFKLVQVGVPPLALRPKMMAEGLDPNLLETPNAPAPPQLHTDVDSEFGSDSGTEDEFSD